MSKKIVHFQIPYNENGYSNVPVEELREFLKVARDVLGEDYCVLTTPLIPMDENIENVNLESLNKIPVNDWDSFILEKVRDNKFP